MDTSKDSRRDPRAKILSLTVRYKSATVAEFLENHSYDVSRGGLFIRTNAPFPSGTLIKFEVRIAEEQQLLTGVGRVAWRRERDRGEDAPAGMGIKFIKIDDASVGIIDRLVSSRPQGDSSFEAGAQEQGIPLSDPPVELRNGKEDRISSRPPPASEMLDQSSALLKSTLDAISSSRPNGFEREEERVTLPTGQGLPASVEPSSVETQPTSALEQASADAVEVTAEQALSKPEATPVASAEERRGKGKKRPKKEKKRKKKFRYASIPNPKPPSSHAVAASVAPLSLPSVTTTPPRKRKTEPPPPSAPNNTIWFVLATVVVLLGLYWINRSEDSGPQGPQSDNPAQALDAPRSAESVASSPASAVTGSGPNVVPLPTPALSANAPPAHADSASSRPAETSAPVRDVNPEAEVAAPPEGGRRPKERKRDESGTEQGAQAGSVRVIPVTPSPQQPEPQRPSGSEVAPPSQGSPVATTGPTPAAPGTAPTPANPPAATPPAANPLAANPPAVTAAAPSAAPRVAPRAAPSTAAPAPVVRPVPPSEQPGTSSP